MEFDSLQGQKFFSLQLHPDPFWAPFHSSPRGKWPVYEADHSPAYSAEVKSSWCAV